MADYQEIWLNISRTSIALLPPTRPDPRPDRQTVCHDRTGKAWQCLTPDPGPSLSWSWPAAAINADISAEINQGLIFNNQVLWLSFNKCIALLDVRYGIQIILLTSYGITVYKSQPWMSGQLSNSAAVFNIQVTSSRWGIVNPTNRHFQFRHFIVHFICIPIQGKKNSILWM